MVVRDLTGGSGGAKKKKGDGGAFDAVAGFVASKNNPLNKAFGAIPNPIRRPIAGAFDILDTPRAAIFATAKELRDANNGAGFSPVDLIRQTRSNISAAEALDLQRFGTLGKLGGLGLDIGVGIATAPGLRSVQSGAANFARGSRIAGIAEAVNTTERAVSPLLERLGVTGKAAREAMPEVAAAAARTDPAMASSLSAAVKMAAGRLIPGAEFEAATGKVRRLSLGNRTIAGTEGLADSFEALKAGLGKGALIEKVSRQNGEAKTVWQYLDSFGQTNSRLRGSAIGALATGDMRPFLHELETTAVRYKGVAAKSRFALQAEQALADDVKNVFGTSTSKEALKILRAMPDRGAGEALAWVEGTAAADSKVAALLNSSWERFKTVNADILAEDPQFLGMAKASLDTGIRNFAADFEQAMTWPGGVSATGLGRFKMFAAGNTDVVSSAIAGWARNSASAAALQYISTPENLARVALSGLHAPEGVLLSSVEEGIQTAMIKRDLFRRDLFTSKVLGRVSGLERKTINATARAAQARADAAARGAVAWDEAVGTVQGVANTFPEFGSILDPIQTKYVKLATEWSDVKTVRTALEGKANEVVRSVAASGPGENQMLGYAQRAQTAMADKLVKLKAEQANVARRMNLARAQFNTAEQQLFKISESLGDVPKTVPGMGSSIPETAIPLAPNRGPGFTSGMGSTTSAQAATEDVTRAAKQVIEADHRLAISNLEADLLSVQEKAAQSRGAYQTAQVDVAQRIEGAVPKQGAGGPFAKSGMPSTRLQQILNTAGDADEAFMQATVATMWDGAVRWGKYGLMDTETYERLVAAFPGTDAVGKFTRHVQGLTNIFRSSAIASPAFSNRNFVGAMLNNFAHGVTWAKERWAAKVGAKYFDDLERSGAEAAYAAAPFEVREAVDRMGDLQHSASRGVEGNLFSATRLEDVSQTFQQHLDRAGWSARGVLTGTVNEKVKVEFVVRLAAFKQFIDDGMTAEGAWYRVQRIHFDYTDLSHFDIASKRIVPFWTWTTRNLPAQAELLARNMGIGAKLDMAMLNSQQNDGALPPWLMGGGFSLGGGRALDFSGVPSADLFGVLHGNKGPVEAARSLFGQSVGPVVKIPFELMSGRQMVTGRPATGFTMASELVPGLGTIGRTVPQLALPGLESKSRPSNPFLALVNSLGSPVPWREYRNR